MDKSLLLSYLGSIVDGEVDGPVPKIVWLMKLKLEKIEF